MSANSSSVLLNFSPTAWTLGVTDTITLAAGASAWLDIDLSAVDACQGLICVRYAATDGVGVITSTVPGLGKSLEFNIKQPVPCLLWTSAPTQTEQFYSNLSQSLTMAPPAIGVTYSDFVFTDPFLRNMKFQRFFFRNGDSNACTIQVRLNV